MRNRSSNSSKRGAYKRSVDEGRSRSSCSGKSRKRDSQEQSCRNGRQNCSRRERRCGKGSTSSKCGGRVQACTYNLLNAKWVLTGEGTHGRRVKHGLEGRGLGSSGPLCTETQPMGRRRGSYV